MKINLDNIIEDKQDELGNYGNFSIFCNIDIYYYNNPLSVCMDFFNIIEADVEFGFAVGSVDYSILVLGEYARRRYID